MNASPDLPPDKIYCSRCLKPIGKDAKYCPHCGTYQNFAYEQKILEQAGERWEIIKSTIVFYLVYLATILPLFWLKKQHAASGEIVIGFVDALLILVYWQISRTPVLPLFGFNRKTVNYLLLGIGFLAPLLVVNFAYHKSLIELFGVQEIKLIEPFITAGYGFGTIVFAACLMPAIWEEIAFRGLIQTGLNKKFRKWETIFITSALFAVIHITVFSWPYLFLLGVMLGFLRMKTQSLWPVMAVHFLHNFVVIYIEYYGGPI